MERSFLNILEYKHIERQFQRLEQDPANYFHLLQPELPEQINQALIQYSLVFITGPIQIGKTSLLKVVESTYKNKVRFASNIDACFLKTLRNKINTSEALYFKWYTEIVDGLLKMVSKHRQDLPIEEREKLEENIKYEKWLEQNSYLSETYLHGFLRTISKFKDLITGNKNSNDDAVVSFHLDDVQLYVNETVFSDLKDHIITLATNPPVDIRIKLVIASRYLPKISLKTNAVPFLEFFDIIKIEKLSRFFIEEMESGEYEEFNKLIFDKTDGYPWFVTRFFLVYLRHRISAVETEPLKLAEQIFNEYTFWTEDAFFDKPGPSKFLVELQSLIKENPPKARREFINFIQSDLTMSGLNNSWNNPNHYLIRQSGFFKISTESDVFENNGCYVLREHFKPVIDIF